MGHSAAGLITSRRGHEFCIGSRTASGSCLAGERYANPPRRLSTPRFILRAGCPYVSVNTFGIPAGLSFEARAVAPQIADQAVDSHPVIVRDSTPFSVRRRGSVSALAFDKDLQLANHICVRHRELVLRVT